MTNEEKTKLSRETGNLIRKAKTFDEGCKAVVDCLHDAVETYDWTGIYMVNGDYLDVKYYRGEKTPHTRILIGEGVCSLAVERETTVIVPDVSLEPTYLSCSDKTKSEIVVPLIKNGDVIGEIDIDSHALDAFNGQDRQLLEAVAYRLTRLHKLQ